MLRRKKEKERTHSIPSRIKNALDAAANSLESISAHARSALREALDALAGFGREVLRRLAAKRSTDEESQRLIELLFDTDEI